MSEQNEKKRLYSEFLFHCITNAVGTDDQVYIARKLGVTHETVNRWKNGATQPRTGNLQTIARIMYEKSGENDKNSVEEDLISSEFFFRRHFANEVRLDENPPTMARKFLIATSRLTAESKLIEAAPAVQPAEGGNSGDSPGADSSYTDTPEPTPKPPDLEGGPKPPTVNKCENASSIALLESPSFTQVADPSTEFELIFRLLFQHIEDEIDGITTLLGLREAHCDVLVEGCSIEKRYFSEDRDHGLHIREGEGGIWRITGPMDAFGFLSDQVMREPICFGKRTSSQAAKLEVKVFAKRYFFSADQPHRRQLTDEVDVLVDRMLTIFLMDKQHRGADVIELCHAVVEW